MARNIKWTLVASACFITLGAAQAFPTVPAPLEGRTITGAKVASTDASAVMEYDPNLDLTWLRDWNVNGAQTWPDQMAWAAGLQVGTFGNWSLPTALNEDGSGPCGPYNCIDTPIGYMYYVELGNAVNGPLTQTGPFQNLLTGTYWTSTANPTQPGGYVAFYTGAGVQLTLFPPTFSFLAVAVRPGDVAAVPEPQTWALTLAGLAALATFVRRRERQETRPAAAPKCV